MVRRRSPQIISVSLWSFRNRIFLKLCRGRPSGRPGFAEECNQFRNQWQSWPSRLQNRIDPGIDDDVRHRLAVDGKGCSALIRKFKKPADVVILVIPRKNLLDLSRAQTKIRQRHRCAKRFPNPQVTFNQLFQRHSGVPRVEVYPPAGDFHNTGVILIPGKIAERHNRLEDL